MNLENTIRLASKRLKSNNIPSYALDAQIILADILGVERESLITNNQMNISDKNLKPHLHYINQRITFIKTIKYINEGKLIKALKNIIFFPIGFNKIKLILYVILPRKFYNKIGKFNQKT